MESSVGTMTIRALRSGSSDDFAELTRLCTDDVAFTSAVSSPASGPREVVQTLERFQAAGRFAKTETWESVATTAGITVIATLPLSSFYQRYEWNIALDETGKIRAIAQIGVAQTAPLPPAPVALTAEITQALGLARETRNPLILAYVDGYGQPVQSPRGTTQVFNKSSLAFWNHNPDGGAIRAIRLNPRLSLHYWGGIGTSYGGALSFQGRATIAVDELVRTRVYDGSPESEQRSDPGRAGCAVIVELDAVSGFLAGTRYNMVVDRA